MSFLLGYPLVTHLLLSLLYAAMLTVPLHALYGFHGFHGGLVAAAIVSTFFYGREAGQREHELKRSGTNPWLAWLGATLLFLWSRSNWVQWLVPAGGSLGLVLMWGWHTLAKLPWL